MGKPKYPPSHKIDHRVAREVVNPIVNTPRRVLIVLEHPLQPQDGFALEPGKTALSVALRLKIDKTHTAVEFQPVRDGGIYAFDHLRGLGVIGGPARDVVEGHLRGSILNDPRWTTPGLKSVAVIQRKRDGVKIQRPKLEPTRAQYEILNQQPIDFTQVHADQPQRADK